MLKQIHRRKHADEEECFYVESSTPLTEREVECIRWLVADTFAPHETAFEPFLLPDAFVEIGPRLSVETPFSSNAVAICHAMGLTSVTRIERSQRHQLSRAVTEEGIVAAHLDRMTQEVYRKPVTTFDLDIAPAPIRFIPLMEEGADALKAVNKSLGLGMDAWDIEFYTKLFRSLGRNPTDVELFQIGNMNSEHCRHWFFRGKLVIDGVQAPYSLFDLVRMPLQVLEPTHSVLAFKDNAGAMCGHDAFVFVSERPGFPARILPRLENMLITATAETHNHPTMVAPYPGAATGSGGRIRDNSAAGRGSLPGVGFAGYCVGNLFLPDYVIAGEGSDRKIRPQYASAAQILIEGSNGASNYQNSFGEPLIGGITRSFGQVVAGERRSFVKPVLYTAGIGSLRESHAEKHPPQLEMLVIRIGGPAYRIGVGGGAASSMMQGANTAELDFASVQRGNPEMANRAVRVIRACIEMGDENPIESIHDQGAGGPSNVLTELLEPAGGKLDIRRIIVGDKTMSVLEIWSSEFQEGFGLLVKLKRLQEFQAICARERVNCEVVGEITGDGSVTVIDSSQFGVTPVHLFLEDVLTGIPQKTFEMERIPQRFSPLVLPADLDILDALKRVFSLPQVGSKAFLTSKADRSVGGLVAQQQCCGPAQIPIGNVAVSASGFFDLTGAAGAIGEQPGKMLISPAAGARMSVGEMITNMVSARISDLSETRCRANWMWPAKLPGEGARLHDAVIAMRDIMLTLGIAADGGKDSLSMAATVNEERIKSPGQLVVLGYAPVPDITQVMTPDFKYPGKTEIGFIDLGRGKNRLGGSSLAQAFGQLGDETPDVDNPGLLADTFQAVQLLIGYQLIESLHDRSDGGLITTVVEMCLAANCGAEIRIPPSADTVASLFSEELGFVFEYLPEQEARIRDILGIEGIPFVHLGSTTQKCDVVVFQGIGASVLRTSTEQLRLWWEATSSRLDLLQANPETVAAEATSHGHLINPTYHLSFRPTETSPEHLASPDKPRVAVLREEGTNGDREMAAALYAAGLDPYDITMSDLLEGRIALDATFRGVVFPGGFSYMDVFGSGRGWAGVIRENQELRAMFDQFYDRPDTFSLGVCNGCQLMALLGWVPWRGIPETAQPRFVQNTSRRFESRWAQVRVTESPSIFFRGMEGSTLGVWVAHGEGRLVFPDPMLLPALRDRSCLPLAYVDPQGEPTDTYPYNPNGSPGGLTALCSPDGRHLALMPHPERCFLKWQMPWMPQDWHANLEASPWLKMFQNIRAWCVESLVRL